MKFKATSLLLFSVSIALGQNLVPNPGFDDLSDCPNDFGQIALAFPWVSATTNMFNSSPSLYNACSTEPKLSPPTAGRKFDSYQVPRSGDGYTGLSVWINDNVNVNQYIAAPLTGKLVKSKQYYAEFYVSPDIAPSMDYWCYTDAVGLALLDTFYLTEIGGHDHLPLNPVIENRGTLIKDTASWTKISGCFIADGTEKYVFIGNFRPDNETLAEISDPDVYNYYSYFYIEDVLVQLFDPLPDTVLLCDGQPKQLNAGFLDAKHKWSTGQTDSIITVTSPGLYTVEAIMDNCVLYDTVMVLDTRDYSAFAPDTTICSDEPITLNAPLPGEYLWSNGAMAKSIPASTSGSYSVTVTNECGEYSFSTQVAAKECTCNIYVPNAISPNGDGINDELRAYVGCDYDYRVLRFGVFDRWGGQVYAVIGDEDIVWDGNARGKPALPGMYVWLLEYEVVKGGAPERHIEKGEVNLVQ